MNKVYKPQVTAQEMSIDGWSRGLEPKQTITEMKAMGVAITEQQLAAHWARLNEGFNSTTFA